MLTRPGYLPLFVVFALFAVSNAYASDPIVGVNVINPYRLNIADQDVMLSNIHNAGVHVIRASITPDDAGLDFASRASKQGIKIVWMIFNFGGFVDGAPKRPNWPAAPAKPRYFASPGLSAVSPDIFRTFFAPLLAKLEDKGVVLAGFELGNEINLSSNPDFPLPGKGGVQLGLADLSDDPEGRQVARGYLQYLKVLAVLKDVRNHSKLNQHTPIVSAGLGNYERPEGRLPAGIGQDMVSPTATIAFLRAHGLDDLVDGYGIHVYPFGDSPGDPAAAGARRKRLAKFDFPYCAGPEGGGKPCWLTEWGFNNKDTRCPIDDADRTTLSREMMRDFRTYVQSGKLAALLYFSWNGGAGNFGGSG